MSPLERFFLKELSLTIAFAVNREPNLQPVVTNVHCGIYCAKLHITLYVYIVT